MEEIEKAENYTDNGLPHSNLYVPGKLKTNPSNGRLDSAADADALPEKNTLNLTTCNSSHARLSRPISLFSSEFRKIDTDLKKMHRIWSNID